MAEFLYSNKLRVRRLTRDTNIGPPGPVFNDGAIGDEINNALLSVMMEVYPGATWSTSLVTYAANDYDYTLSSGTAYRSIILVRDNATGQSLARVSPEQLQQLREGTPGTSTPPSAYAITEGVGAFSAVMDLWPTPSGTGTLDALVSALPAILTTNSDNFAVSQAIERAVSYRAASLLVASIGTESLKRLGLSPNAPQAFENMARSLIEGEKRRASGIYTGTITLSDAVVD